jgi:hypothetical protein
MTPREHLELVVRPNMREMLANLDDLRLAFNAIAAVDSLAAQVYWWAYHHKPSLVLDATSDDAYRHRLVAQNNDFRLMFETAKAIKHGRLIRGEPPSVRAVDQVVAKGTEWDKNMRWDDFHWDTTQVRIEPVGGETPWTVEGVLRGALAFLEEEMATLEIP